MTNHLYLLDAYALIYRAYYALIKNPRINSKGFNTSAVFGFVRNLEEVRRMPSTHIAVAFDPKGGKTFRNKLYPPYKAQREITPEDIKKSVPIIKNIIEAYNIPILEDEDFEADDIIGTASKKFSSDETEVFMITADKDYGQLVTPHVWMLKPEHGGNFSKLGVEEIKAKYGISSPSQIIDLLGLMGDAVDNIPGCPGVGEKTAVKLIAEYGSVEGVISHVDDIKGKLKDKISDSIEQIRLSRKLAEIRTDVPLTYTLEDLKVKEPNLPALKQMFAELEFRSLMNSLDNTSGKKEGEAAGSLFDNVAPETPANPKMPSLFPDEDTETQKYANLDSLKTVAHDYYLVENKDEMRKLCQKFLSAKNLSLDTETTSTNAMTAELVGLSFSTKEFEAYYIPIPAEREKAQEIVDIFKPVYESNVPKTGQNIKYDILVLANYGVKVNGPLFDTMVAHYVMQSELPHNMDSLAESYLHYSTVKIEELIGAKGKGQKNMRSLPPSDVYEYACEDADVTLRLRHALEPELSKYGVSELFNNVEMPLIRVLADMEFTGVRIDSNALKETSELFSKRMNEYENKVYSLAGEKFNLSSPRQVGEVLFNKMHLVQKPKKTKTGQYVTSEEVLEPLRAQHEVVDYILKFRAMKKLISTYLDALPQLVNPKTGKIHTSFNQTVTSTGRLSSSNPNLQNIPVRDDDGKEIRKAFIPDEGCLFFSADYSQIELRVMAHLAQDQHMIEAFNKGEDIHATTAAKIYHKPITEVTKEERSKAKTANFGIIYGISAFGLSQRLNVSRTEAKELIDNYFKEYPSIREYMDKSIQKARDLGYVETILKRRRYLPDINSKNSNVRGNAERNAINAPIQGSEADIIKIAMVGIYRRFEEQHLRSKLMLQVHDELNFSVYPDEKEQVQKIVTTEMENAYKMSVPLKVDVGWGSNWLEAH